MKRRWYLRTRLRRVYQAMVALRLVHSCSLFDRSSLVPWLTRGPLGDSLAEEELASGALSLWGWQRGLRTRQQARRALGGGGAEAKQGQAGYATQEGGREFKGEDHSV